MIAKVFFIKVIMIYHRINVTKKIYITETLHYLVKKMVKGMKFALLTGIILIGMIIGASPAKASPYIPSAVLTFDESSKVIDASPGADRTVIFNATLTSDCATAYTVSLEVDEKSIIPLGWSVAVSPSGVRHESGPHTDYISVIVRAPPEESYAETATIVIQSYTSRADVGFSYYGGSGAVSASVKPFYRISIACDKPYQEVSPGTEMYFNILVTNLGNINDIFKIEISNIDDFPGWVIQPENSTVSVPEKSAQTARIKILTPHEWTLWKDDVARMDIKVTSTVSSDVSPVYGEYSVYLRQRGTYIPGFDTVFIIVALGLIAVILKKKHG